MPYSGVITIKGVVDTAMIKKIKMQWAAAVASSSNAWCTPIISEETYTWSVDYAAPNMLHPDAEWY